MKMTYARGDSVEKLVGLLTEAMAQQYGKEGVNMVEIVSAAFTFARRSAEVLLDMSDGDEAKGKNLELLTSAWMMILPDRGPKH